MAYSEQKPIIVHLTTREGLSSAYLPQVARPMSLVRERDFDVSLVVLAPLGELMRAEPRRRWTSRRREVTGDFDLPLTLLPSAPSRVQGLWDDARLLRLWLSTRPCGPMILHCRGTQATQAALRARGRRNDVAIVCDCRGIDGPEYLSYLGIANAADAAPEQRAEALYRDHAQRSAIEHSDAVFCVSNAMRRTFEDRWGVPLARSRTVPCCTDATVGRQAAEKRETMRRRLGLTDKFVVSYSGSAAPWQALPETLAAFKQIANIRPDAHLLVLTTERAKLASAITQAGVSAGQATLLSVPHAEVPPHLAAADLGLLLREDSIVNRVASPMKFAEYMACGVPVVLSDGIGDYSDLVRQSGTGCVLPSTTVAARSKGLLRTFLANYAASPAGLRALCMDLGARRLAWPDAVDVICQSYVSILSNALAGCPDREMHGAHSVGRP